MWTAVVVAQVAAMVALPVVAFYLRGAPTDIRVADPGFPSEQFLSLQLEMDRGIEWAARREPDMNRTAGRSVRREPEPESDRPTEPGAPVDASPAEFRARYGAAYRELEVRLEAEPAVAGVSFADGLPLMMRDTRRIELDEGGAALRDSSSGPPRVFAYVALMVGVCMLASIVPVRRALRIEPTEALKADG